MLLILVILVNLALLFYPSTFSKFLHGPQVQISSVSDEKKLLEEQVAVEEQGIKEADQHNKTLQEDRNAILEVCSFFRCTFFGEKQGNMF